MRRTNDWPAEPTAPGDLPLLLAFLNTEDPESGIDVLASSQALSHWLERHGLLSEQVELSEADLERARAARSISSTHS